jgi:tetratricopeptide (TPR) repeat protein
MTVELPAGPKPFVNRDEERALADRAVQEGAGRGRAVALSLSGPVGVGTSGLAYEIGWALYEGRGYSHVLHVDLDDYRAPDGWLDSGDVLTQLLESLGVEPESVKVAFGPRRRQYRNVTSQTRVVLVLDNARYGSELEDLLPASDGVVIVTSHRPLHDLDGGAGVDVPVGPLGDRAARELLEGIISGGRLAADPGTAEALLRLCEGSPSALRIAACTVRRHGLRPLSRLLDEVRGELDERVAPVVDRVLGVGYGELTARAALLYRLLSVHPGPTFTRASAAALLGLGADACDAGLEELHGECLADVREAFEDPGARLRMSQAQRAHARRQTGGDAGEDECARAQERFLRWETRQWQRSDLLTAGDRLRVQALVDEVPGAPDVPFADPGTAETGEERAERLRRLVRWQYEDRHVLFASARLAYARGEDDLCVALCECVWTYALDHPPKADLIAIFRLGLECAIRAGDVRGIVRMRCQVARWLWESDTAAAEVEMTAALASAVLLTEGPFDTKLRASAIEFRGMLDSALGDLTSAAARFTESRGLQASIGNTYGVMLQDYRLGQTQVKLGDLAEAERLLALAHTSAAGLKRERMTARTGFALGHVLRDRGRTDEARRLYQESLDSARRRESGFDEARVRDVLAELARQEGRIDEAEQHETSAAAIRRRNGLD